MTLEGSMTEVLEFLLVPSFRMFAALALGALVVWIVALLPPVVLCCRLPGGARGHAQPGLVLLAPEVFHDERVLRHELAHIRQMRRFSPYGAAVLLAVHYGGGLLAARLRGRPTGFFALYRTNPLEIEANAAMAETTPLPAHLRVGSPERSARLGAVATVVGGLYLVGTVATLLWAYRLG